MHVKRGHCNTNRWRIAACRVCLSRQNEKFLIGQSRKFLLTAERLGYGTNRDEPRGTRLVGMVKAGPRRDGDTAKRGRGHGCERAVGTQAAGQNGNARRWGGGSRVARKAFQPADRCKHATASDEDFATAGVA